MFFTSTSRLIVDYFLLVDYFISRLLVDYRLVDGSLTIHFTHNLTRGMLYLSMLLHVNLDSLAARSEELSRRFSVILWILSPVFSLHSLFPPPRSTAITTRLRSSQILPKVYTRT